MFKIIGAAGSRPDRFICEQCSYAIRIKTPAESQDSMYCKQIRRMLTHKIVECGAFSDKNRDLAEATFGHLALSMKHNQITGNITWVDADYNTIRSSSNPAYTTKKKRGGQRSEKTKSNPTIQ